MFARSLVPLILTIGLSIAPAAVLGNTPPAARGEPAVPAPTVAARQLPVLGPSGAPALRLLLPGFSTVHSTVPDHVWDTVDTSQHNLEFNNDWKQSSFEVRMYGDYRLVGAESFTDMDPSIVTTCVANVASSPIDSIKIAVPTTPTAITRESGTVSCGAVPTETTAIPPRA